ncbi:MAG TPA: O-antigen ligase family protein [Patescibacteria group bacterium]|uniref:O-antigen ligase-related domain-containing protein n=1 Tax=Candidatus Woesebacteria bacterium RBG_13_46_13 TaxID=1802479 RepID=A0A1F7X5A6_9BACT|nr:MAG: hypothetical protein A2Y68_00480 [Candidatus Woesebacteria bacterium RBG_13_46_13]HJX59390.1 O-antigen ligase family protein [Patescibacteria group bacterium]
MRFVSGLIGFIRRYSVLFVLVSIFLIKTPPFYLFPPIKSSLLTTHTLSRLFILLAFAGIYWEEIREKAKPLGQNAKLLLWFFVVYLIFQSLSLVGASNVIGFLQRYKDVVFPGLLLFVVVARRIKREKVVLIFLLAASVNFVYQMIMFFLPHIFRSWGNELVYSGHLELVLINLERGRMFIETYDEIAIPFIFFLLAKHNGRWARIGLIAIFLMVALPSFLSNFRSRAGILIIAFLASFLFLTGRKIKEKIVLVCLFLFLAMTAVIVSNTFFGFSVVDRFALRDTREDVETLLYRAENIGTSVDMGISQPLTGIGLGNYFDNLATSKKMSKSLFNWVQREAEIASTNPHDIFLQTLSETGVLSLIFVIMLLGYFAYSDIIALKSKDYLTKALIIAFWTLFSYSLFNPTTTLGYNSLFWLLRGLIIL